MTDILFTAYDEHTQQVRDFTRQAITKLINEHGANEDWISVGSLYCGVSGMYLGHIMDGKLLLTVDEFVQRQMSTVVDVVLGFQEPWGEWAERNQQGRKEVRYDEWRES